MTALRRFWALLAFQAGDQFPAWLLWSGVALSVAAIAYGVATDWKGFLLNIAATLALLWFSLLVGHRLLRWRRQRPLKPKVDEIPAHLRNILRRLLDEANGVGARQDRQLLDAVGNNGPPRERLHKVGEYATTLAGDLTAAAAEQPREVERQKAALAALTLDAAVLYLDDDLRRIESVVPMMESRLAFEKVRRGTQEWIAFEGVPTASVDVLLVAASIAETIHALAGHLVVELPRSLT